MAPLLSASYSSRNQPKVLQEPPASIKASETKSSKKMKAEELKRIEMEKVQRESQEALRRFYRNAGEEEVFIPDWQGNGEWVSVSRGEAGGRGLKAGEIQEILNLFSQSREFKPSTSGVSRLAAITSYWKIGSNTDHWTRRGQSSTGVSLRQGIVAVDPTIIPYGSMVIIEGVPGAFIAADCGSHVSQRVAVKKTARTAKEKEAVVIDVYFVREKEGRAFDSALPKFVKIHYFTPQSRNS